MSNLSIVYHFIPSIAGNPNSIAALSAINKVSPLERKDATKFNVVASCVAGRGWGSNWLWKLYEGVNKDTNKLIELIDKLNSNPLYIVPF